MEEDEAIGRRDAVLGLGLLGGLLAALVGTIFFRIVNPSAPARTSLDGLTIATELAEPPAWAAAAMPPVAPVRRDGDVQAAGFENAPAESHGATSPRPTFVAPGTR